MSSSWIVRSTEGLRITLPEDCLCWPKPRGSLSTSQTCNRYVGLGDREILVEIARSANCSCVGLDAIGLTWDSLELLKEERSLIQNFKNFYLKIIKIWIQSYFSKFWIFKSSIQDKEIFYFKIIKKSHVSYLLFILQRNLRIVLFIFLENDI